MLSSHNFLWNFSVGNFVASLKSFCRIRGSRVFPTNHLKRTRN